MTQRHAISFKSFSVWLPVQKSAVFNSYSIQAMSFLTSSTETSAAFKSGFANPTVVAPRAINFAASKPWRTPPEPQISKWGLIESAFLTLVTVSMPQSLNVSEQRLRMKFCEALSPSIRPQCVPPKPLTSTAATPDFGRESLWPRELRWLPLRHCPLALAAALWQDPPPVALCHAW